MGIDLVGPLPRAAGNNRYIIVAVDYFTKWVEAEPLASITGARCQKFVHKNILTRFGVPQEIISDNGTQFEAAPFQEILREWGIKHRFSSVAYPQGNGQVENANRTIMEGLKKNLQDAGGSWVDELPNILWCYRTTPRRATGETPFALCYGFEAKAPTEVTIPSRRVEQYDPEVNEENMKIDLHLVEDRREQAFIRAENYRRQVKSYYDAKVRSREFQVGDYILRRREAIQPTEGGKLALKYEGPYIVSAVVKPGTYKLKRPNGSNVPRTWNVHHLVKFYQ
ncbi:unnamed protein product [Cuscuta europaea]|uniref:Integrase catalytic domain-containing protein n=1 Tax=Cuscuta europaea TaxID=41803 RepID=A0A9P0ZU35_CUSEU|nr:unnamed protein product [Cuscuta europaea]